MVRSLAKTDPSDLAVLWMVLPKFALDVVSAAFDCAWRDRTCSCEYIVSRSLGRLSRIPYVNVAKTFHASQRSSRTVLDLAIGTSGWGAYNTIRYTNEHSSDQIPTAGKTG
jgi:hypothetical protein